MSKFIEKLRTKVRLKIWKYYPKLIKSASYLIGRRVEPSYKTFGFKEGVLPRNLLDQFMLTIRKAKTKPISQDDYNPIFTIHGGLKAYEQPLNSSHKLYVLEKEQFDALKPIIEELKEPIAKCLGTPWRIVNILCWETHSEAIETGPNEWHSDGMPYAVQKIMIYLTGAGQEIGTTGLKLNDGSIRYVEGPPGTWMLFKISEIIHKGIKPKIGTRIVLEIRAIPSFRFDLRPFCAGFNAHYPKLPWLRLHKKTSEAIANNDN